MLRHPDGMKWPTLGVLILCLVTASRADDAALTPEGIALGLRQQVEKFEPVSVEKRDVPVTFELRLGDDPALIGTNVFDGFRFVVPEGVAERDFVWFFNAPESWGNWYVLPLGEPQAGGFTDWLRGDKVYEDVDGSGTTDRLRILQALPAPYFAEGREYLIWFRNVSEAGGGTLRGKLSFAPQVRQWTHQAIETALQLRPLDARRQVEALDSRGGRILLEPAFFSRDEAEERIESLFFSMRQSREFRSGFSISMNTTVPTCTLHPRLDDIEAVYGLADFEMSSSEQQKVREHQGLTAEEDSSTGETVTYYFDFFGFEVEAGDKHRRVQRVVTQAGDYSKARPLHNQAQFVRLPKLDLTLFHLNHQEAGRIYFFLRGDRPLVIREPPVGTYRSGAEELDYKGDGEWRWRTFYPGGGVARDFELKDHKVDGVAKVYYQGGVLKLEARYKNGLLDGETVEFAPDGTETGRKSFSRGQPSTVSP